MRKTQRSSFWCQKAQYVSISLVTGSAQTFPARHSWRLIGQYSYSLLEEKPLERFAGIEYEACCWRIRLTSRHYIVRSTGDTDETISIQLELKGLSQRSATPEELLGRGILSYRRLEANAE